MDAILGLAMIYTWVHGVIIVSRRTENTTQYEKVVLIAGAIGFALILTGIVME